jgi:hypothetical protein
VVELLPDDDELLLVWVATFGLPAAAGALPTPFVPPFGAARLACARANWATGEIVTVSADSEVQLDVVQDAAGVEHLVQLAPGRDRRLGNAQQRLDRPNKAIGPLIAQKLR